MYEQIIHGVQYAGIGMMTVICLSFIALPVLIAWFYARNKRNEMNKRSEILLAAIEKNPDIDMEEFIQKMNPPQKKLKEKLLKKLMWGCIFCAIGISLLVRCLWFHLDGFAETECSPFGGVLFIFIGLSILLAFFVGKKFLAKEIEAEEEKTCKQ